MESGGLDKLFFELASESRLGMLNALNLGSLRMMEIAHRLNITDTETSRQLQRLVEAGLVQKQADGTYMLTTYARLILEASSLMGFVYDNKRYFSDHNMFLIPSEFRARLGELSGAKMISSTVETLNWVTEMFKNAEKKYDGIVVGLDTMVDTLLQRFNEGLQMRLLIYESYLPKAKFKFKSFKKLPEMRWITESIHGHVGVSDKAAVFTIRLNDGAFSYDAFVGEDPSFRKFAEDLFMYEWERAKPWFP